MTYAEFNTMNSIINDLSIDALEQLKNYADDCDILGANSPAKYITNQLRREQAVDLSMVRYHLTRDFSGC